MSNSQQKVFPFYFSSQADLCASCVHIWPMHLLQQCWSCHKTLPLSICELLAVLCTLQTFDPACLLHLLFCYKLQCFQAFLNRCRLLNHDGVMKGGHWFVLLCDIGDKCEILGKSKNRRVSITLPGRLELLWNFSFVWLRCPNKCQFFVFRLIFKVNRRKEIIFCYISHVSVLTRNRLNQCADDIICQSTRYLIIFFCPNTLSHSSCISWHNHTSFKFWFRTCSVFFIAGIHIFLWMVVIFHRCWQLNQTNTMIYTNQWTCPQKRYDSSII